MNPAELAQHSLSGAPQEIKDTLAPQLQSMFEIMLANATEEEAKSAADQLQGVNRLCQEGDFQKAAEILVENGLPEGYARYLVQMVGVAYANNPNSE